ncbi:MAG: TonB C-terminal domain-containing protein [Sulfuricurvum sp.]|nr:TonB C-terminal domain-containing protein [Sulfuricurvum sp.]
MGLHEDRYFFISGIISISFFFFLLFIFAYSNFLPTKIEQAAMNKSEFISVSISMSKAKEKSIAVAETKPTMELEKTISESEQTVPEVARIQSKPVKTSEPTPEINDLFSNVKPEKIVQKPQHDTKRLDALNALEKKVLTQNETTSNISEKVKNIELAKPMITMVVQGGSSGPAVNEYHAKIQGLVYANFHPPTGTQGQMARVKMYISASGQLTVYKVISYSSNGTFNSEVDWLKERLSRLIFPVNPDGKDAVLEFILTAKDKS